MTTDPSRLGGAALRDHQGYRAKPRLIEAELWYAPLDASGKVGRWIYCRRHASAQPGDADRRVEAEFREWVEGQLEAEGH